MRLSGMFLFLSVCVLSLAHVLAAPLEEVVGNRNEVKRSGEVIFFENEQKRGEMKSKRADFSWPKYSSNSETSAAAATSLEEKPDNSGQRSENMADSEEDNDEQSKLKMELEFINSDSQLTKELEEWAFSQAVDYIVDKLIDEAIKEDMLDTSMLGLFTQTPSTRVLEPTEFLEDTTAKVVQTAATAATKISPDALAFLVKQSQLKPFQPPKPVKADEQKSSRIFGGEEQKKKSEFKEMVSPEPEQSDNQYSKFELTETDTGDEGDYDRLEEERKLKLLEYYMQSFQMMEGKLRGEYDDLQGASDPQTLPKVDTGAKSKSLGRKKRSVSDDWFDGEPQEPAGVCFSPEEATDLKKVLVNMAEEKMQLEEQLKRLTKMVDVDKWNGADPSMNTELNNLAAEMDADRPVSYYKPSFESSADKRRYSYSPYYFQKKK